MFLKTYFLPDYAEQGPAPGYTAEEVSTTSKYVCICVEILLQFSNNITLSDTSTHKYGRGA